MDLLLCWYCAPVVKRYKRFQHLFASSECKRYTYIQFGMIRHTVSGEAWSSRKKLQRDTMELLECMLSDLLQAIFAVVWVTFCTPAGWDTSSCTWSAGLAWFRLWFGVCIWIWFSSVRRHTVRLLFLTTDSTTSDMVDKFVLVITTTARQQGQQATEFFG